MSLSVDSRACGRLYVIRCSGRIVGGDESRTLEAVFIRALQDSNRLVIEVADVSRVDSSGLGLLVRFLSRVRANGGDMRLASPQPFFRSLLDMTKLSTILRVYGTEEEAIVSFLKDPANTIKETTPAGPSVLFLDQSADLCAFVRKLLNGYGYDAVTTCRMHDAKLLLSASDFSFLVLGPECSQLPCDEVIATLKPLAKAAEIVQLQRGFQMDDVERAASDLLQRMRPQA
ncbi:MAG TPA: STAS domain-containing protein [Verrucomicrobiae bacterium]|jgi:anti-anti-sigma factor|nr:STAS domain-containing protein [Verrucomicrobiae bacterium]